MGWIESGHARCQRGWTGATRASPWRAEVREYFDGAAPDDAGGNTHPELDRFQELQAHTEKLVYEGGKMSEEFMETEYYKDLGSIGKQHHTTGTRFIKIDKGHGASFQLHEDPDGTERHASCKGNPATNEWIPSADTMYQTSDKPSRSDS